jgi:hypothetical protein
MTNSEDEGFWRGTTSSLPKLKANSLGYGFSEPIKDKTYIEAECVAER